MAIMPTLGMRYQHGLPRRVIELSMMSSETRKKAWRSSINQPRVEASKKVWEFSEGVTVVDWRRETVSTTERPRLHLPPIVLCSNDYYVSVLGLPQMTVNLPSGTIPAHSWEVRIAGTAAKDPRPAEGTQIRSPSMW